MENVEWLRGQIESIPLPAETVDVVISNCVINLSGDKSAVLAEAARMLKPGGRFAVSDVIADEDMDEATRAGDHARPQASVRCLSPEQAGYGTASTRTTLLPRELPNLVPI